MQLDSQPFQVRFEIIRRKRSSYAAWFPAVQEDLVPLGLEAAPEALEY